MTEPTQYSYGRCLNCGAALPPPSAAGHTCSFSPYNWFGDNNPVTKVTRHTVGPDGVIRQKADLCRQWLLYCRNIGWKKRDMKPLCDLFWCYDGWKTFKGFKP